MWTSEKLALKAARQTLSRDKASPRTMQSNVWGKATPTFYVCPPVFKYTPGKVTLVKAQPTT